jgi:adenylate cyclase
VKAVGRFRRRQSPLAWRAQALVVSGAVVPTALGSAVIAVMTKWALPTGAALSQRYVLTLNLLFGASYSAIAIPLAIVWGYLWRTLPADSADDALPCTLLTAPSRIAVIHATSGSPRRLSLLLSTFVPLGWQQHSG